MGGGAARFVAASRPTTCGAHPHLRRRYELQGDSGHTRDPGRHAGKQGRSRASNVARATLRRALGGRVRRLRIGARRRRLMSDISLLLASYADGELGPELAQEAEKLIATDPEARAMVEMHRKTAA